MYLTNVISITSVSESPVDNIKNNANIMNVMKYLIDLIYPCLLYTFAILPGDIYGDNSSWFRNSIM